MLIKVGAVLLFTWWPFPALILHLSFVGGDNSFAQYGVPSGLNFARGDEKVFDFNAVYPLLLKKSL
jgi:hypothetical protein